MRQGRTPGDDEASPTADELQVGHPSRYDARSGGVQVYSTTHFGTDYTTWR